MYMNVHVQVCTQISKNYTTLYVVCTVHEHVQLYLTGRSKYNYKSKGKYKFWNISVQVLKGKWEGTWQDTCTCMSQSCHFVIDWAHIRRFITFFFNLFFFCSNIHWHFSHSSAIIKTDVISQYKPPPPQCTCTCMCHVMYMYTSVLFKEFKF